MRLEPCLLLLFLVLQLLSHVTHGLEALAPELVDLRQMLAAKTAHHLFKG